MVAAKTKTFCGRHYKRATWKSLLPVYTPDAMETFQAQLTRKLSDALSSAGLPFAGEVTPATDPRFGDYQSNAAMVLAKQCGENPRKKYRQ